MSLGDRFRRFFSSPAHLHREGAEDAAALRDEYGEPDGGEPYIEQVEKQAGGPGGPGIVALESAEAADDVVESLEEPSDPAS